LGKIVHSPGAFAMISKARTVAIGDSVQMPAFRGSSGNQFQAKG